MNSKIEREKAIVEKMIRLYCRHKEKNKNLCGECKEIIDYAHKRLDNCKYGERKTSCKKCPIHCYRPEMKAKIKAVMRYSGPRIFFYHPFVTIKHYF